MWWFDKKAVATGEQLRDLFQIVDFIETGTFRGLNLKFWSYRFRDVIGVEKDFAYVEKTRDRLLMAKRRNALVYHDTSPDFLLWFVQDQQRWSQDQPPIFIYLDAHFYDSSLPPEKRWVVKDELKALAGFSNCLIAIHDFNCNGLGHLIYDGQSLNFKLIQEDLLGVNPNFHFYGNTREGCEVYTTESIIGVEGLESDEETLETIAYHKTDRLKYRGILYAIPTPLDLSEFPTLKEIKE